MLRKALQYQRLCGGVIALHEEDPTLSRGGAMHEGAVSAALGIGGIPTIAESTMVARDAALAGYEDARVHFQHLSCAASVRGRRRTPRRAAGASAPRSRPHHLLLTERGRAQPGHAHEDEPAAGHRGRPPGARRGPARRHDRLRRHRPRAARARREGGALRAGADGHDRPGDRVRRALHRPRAARRARARAARRADDRGRARCSSCRRRRSPPASRRTSRSSISTPSGSPASTAGRAARRTAASPGARCTAACC